MTSPKTTTVGSYSQIGWLAARPSEQAVVDATSVVFTTQRRSGIDLPTDGELYRFDPNHPDTNGMIEYFVRRMGGVESTIGLSAGKEFREMAGMAFRRKPAGIVVDALHEGSLDLLEACRRSASVADGDFKFTLTSPFMLARTLLDRHYGNLEDLTLAIADLLAEQVSELPAACVQVDEANVPGNPEHAPLAAEAINRILDRAPAQKAVHFCFGNYGGQTIQQGHWETLVDFLNTLRVDHLILEVAHRPDDDLAALQEVDDRIGLGIGVIDVKVNHVESPEEVAQRIERAVEVLGDGRVRWVHPDCGFWMLHRSVTDRKLVSLGAGRDLFAKAGSTT